MMDDVVLVIDDNEDDYLILKRKIGKDYQTDYSNGLGDISEPIQRVSPTCILLDYHLGSKKGTEILQQLKSSYDDIPVVMLTNEVNPDTIVECMKAGADDYLVKDQIDRNRLLVTIQSLTEKYSLKQRVKVLESFLPICACCKKIHEENADPMVQDSWVSIETYISDRTDSTFSHGICPECCEKFYGDKLI